MNRATIGEFLGRPVPPGGTREWPQWQAECKSLGEQAIPEMIAALELGTEAEQYAALLGLRLFGYEAWAHGYRAEYYYTVRPPASSATDELRIEPRIKPLEPE